jgi:hypothetical protein
MSNYFLTLIIAFGVIFFFVYFFTFCRRRIRKTPHGLSGMCHKDGGTICSSCQDREQEDGSVNS